MANLKFDYSLHICAAGQSLVLAPPLGGAPPPCGTSRHQQLLPKFIELIKALLCES